MTVLRLVQTRHTILAIAISNSFHLHYRGRKTPNQTKLKTVERISSQIIHLSQSNKSLIPNLETQSAESIRHSDTTLAGKRCLFIEVKQKSIKAIWRLGFVARRAILLLGHELLTKIYREREVYRDISNLRVYRYVKHRIGPS